jgi:hypothetical protein
MKVFVDASTAWGIGLVLDGQWLAWQLMNGWKLQGRDIGWAEMVAVKLAIQTLITGKFSNCHVIVRSNNQGVVGGLKAGRSRGTQQNLILHEIVKLIQGHDLWISTVWISTSENPADNPSRGYFPNKSLLYAFPPKLPYHLLNLVHKSVDYHDPVYFPDAGKVHNLKWEQIQKVEDEGGIWAMEFHEMIQGRIYITKICMSSYFTNLRGIRNLTSRTQI